MELTDPIKVSLRFIRILDSLGVRYLIGGSLASSLHGIPRATQDVDIVAELDEHHIPFLVTSLEKDFYFDEVAARNALRQKTSFNIIDKEELFKIDVFASDIGNAGEMERRVLFPLAETGGESLYICSAEDIIINKLSWYRLGGNVSQRQWTDVLNVLKVQKGTLDLAYLEKAASAHDVGPLLKKAMTDVKNTGLAE